MAVQSVGSNGTPAVSGGTRYEMYMWLDKRQWLQYAAFWDDALKKDYQSGKVTTKQRDAIIAHRSKLLGGQTQIGHHVYQTPTNNVIDKTKNALDNAGDNLRDGVDNFFNGVEGAVSNVFSGSKYVAIGVGALLLILIVGRR